MSVHLIDGIRRNSFVVYDGNGHYYHTRRFKNNTHYFNCILKYCPARAKVRGVLRNGEPIVRSSEHNHQGNVLYHEVLKFKRKINNRSRTENTPLRKIYEEEVASVPPDIISEVKYESVYCSMYNSRKTALEKQKIVMAENNEILIEDALLSQGDIQALLEGTNEHSYCTAYENDEGASTSAGPSGGETMAAAAAQPPGAKGRALRPCPKSRLFPGYEVDRPQLRPNRPKVYAQQIEEEKEEEEEEGEDYDDADDGGGVQEEEGDEEEEGEEDDSPIQVMWENKERMGGIMTRLFESGKFVDVTLACQGRHLQCHRLVLGACSDYFEDLLQINPSQHPIMMMRDFEFWELEAVVDFIYKGSATVPMSKFNRFIHTARLLRIKGITQMDVEGSTEQVSKFKQMNASRKKVAAQPKSSLAPKPQPPPPPPPTPTPTPKAVQRPVRIVSKRKAPVQPIKEIRPVALSAVSNRKTVEPASKLIKINTPPKKGGVSAALSTVLDHDPDPGDHTSEQAQETGNETTDSYTETAEPNEEPIEEYVVEDDEDEEDGTQEFITQIESFQEYTSASDSVIIKEEPSGTITIENVETSSQPPPGS